MNQFIFNYFLNLRKIFTKGMLKFVINDKKITLRYINVVGLEMPIDGSVELDYTYKTTQDREQLFRLIQGYVIDCYFFYEWDGGKTSVDDLSILLGVSTSSITQTINGIKEKIKTLSENIEHEQG